MTKRPSVLVTGGAGFIGSFLADLLIEKDYPVTIFDNLESQVHRNKKPTYLHPKAMFVKGDVRDQMAFNRVLNKVDIVFHLAASVGVQQSQYEIKTYVDTNVGGMANLLDFAANNKHTIKKIVLMSSMTGYGEGKYECTKRCGYVYPGPRCEEDIKKKKWNMKCPECSSLATSVPTTEDSQLAGNSIYALSKRYQEEMLTLITSLYNIPAVVLRGFNIYGPRQSLSNPYTGVTAIFLSRLKNGKQPIIYEDGRQQRDFVYVQDVVSALYKTICTSKADGRVLNIGSGVPTSIADVATTIARIMKSDIQPYITNTARVNDLRSCYAEISTAKKLLGWKPRYSLESGMKELVTWAENEEATDSFNKAEKELRQKNLA